MEGGGKGLKERASSRERDKGQGGGKGVERKRNALGEGRNERDDTVTKDEGQGISVRATQI
jgi:hypothetical protein